MSLQHLKEKWFRFFLGRLAINKVTTPMRDTGLRSTMGLFPAAVKYRGRGRAQRVTAALAIRASGRVPLYSASWANHASLPVARMMGLEMYASTWSIS